MIQSLKDMKNVIARKIREQIKQERKDFEK